jgi:hypothetical protein
VRLCNVCLFSFLLSFGLHLVWVEQGFRIIWALMVYGKNWAIGDGSVCISHMSRRGNRIVGSKCTSHGV